MTHWIFFAVAAMAMWGVAGFLAKFGTNRIDPQSLMLYQILGMMAIGIAILFFLNFSQITYEHQGAAIGFIRGFLMAAGTLLFLFAIDKGKASIVVPLTALYPIITILLAVVVLGEVITFKQGAGIMLALSAILLLSL